MVSEKKSDAYWQAQANDFIRLAYENGWVIKGFDWPNWQEGRNWMNDPDETKYERIDEEFARKLITALVRQSRYLDSSFAYWIEQGVAQRIANQLTRLSDVIQ